MNVIESEMRERMNIFGWGFVEIKERCYWFYYGVGIFSGWGWWVGLKEKLGWDNFFYRIVIICCLFIDWLIYIIFLILE